MSAAPLPAIVRAQLRVAAKIKRHGDRMDAINITLKEAKLHYPQCFTETQGNQPKERIKSSFEKYIDGLTPRNHTYTSGEIK